MGSKTLNDIFYKPDIGASGAVEKGKFDDGLDVADGLIESNKPANNKISAFAVTTSAELAGKISDKVGSGALVFETALNNRTTQTTEDYTIYCNASTGNDITGDGTSGNPYATIQKCIDMLPTIIAHDVIIAVGADETITSTIDFAGHNCLKTMTLKAMDSSDNNLYDNGVATGGSATTLTDTAKTWTADFWNGGYVYIYQGTGAGEVRTITDTTPDTITIESGTTPDVTSKYVIVMVTITGDGVATGTASELVNFAIYGFRWSTFSSYANVMMGNGSKCQYNLYLVGTGHSVFFQGTTGGVFYDNFINVPATKAGLVLETSVNTARKNCFYSSSASTNTGVLAYRISFIPMTGGTYVNTFINLDIGISANALSGVAGATGQVYSGCNTDYTPIADDPSYCK